MSTSFIEETSHTRIYLHNRLLDTQNELQRKIQQLIKNYGKDSADRRHRDGYYSGKLNQLNDLWQQFCDLDEDVHQAALLTGSEYSSRLVLLNIIKDSIFQYLPNTKTMFMNRGERDLKTTNNGEHFTFCNLELTSETCLNSISAMLPLPSAFAFVLYSAFAFSINFKGRA